MKKYIFLVTPIVLWFSIGSCLEQRSLDIGFVPASA
jgi:hypothetical protein